MREIKFRAWFKRYKLMHPWGDIVETLDFYNIVTNDKYVVMQYTGLKDKNGVEIYEGDIVTYTAQFKEGLQELNVVVQWDDKLAAYILVRNTADLLYEVGEDVLEVIGNVYENPDLLKEAN